MLGDDLADALRSACRRPSRFAPVAFGEALDGMNRSVHRSAGKDSRTRCAAHRVHQEQRHAAMISNPVK
jgi:hypothetical protein